MVCLEVPNTMNKNGCLLWKAAKRIIQSTTLTWEMGGHDMYGLVLYRIVVLLKNPTLRKTHNSGLFFNILPFFVPHGHRLPYAFPGAWNIAHTVQFTNLTRHTQTAHSRDLPSLKQFITFLACSGFKLKLLTNSSEVSSQSIWPSTACSWHVGGSWPKEIWCKKDSASSTDHGSASATQTGRWSELDWLDAFATREREAVMCHSRKLAKQWPHPWMTCLENWVGFVKLNKSKRFKHHIHIPCCKNFFSMSSVMSADKVVMNTGPALEYHKCPENLALRPPKNQWSPFKPEQLQSLRDDIFIDAPIIQEGQLCFLQNHE